MNCINHEASASAICLNCGKALCAECISYTSNGKVSCSPACAEGIGATELVAEQTLNKTKNSSLSGAYGSYILGVIFIGYGLYTNIHELTLFVSFAGAGMLFMGAFFHYTALSNSKKANK